MNVQTWARMKVEGRRSDSPWRDEGGMKLGGKEESIFIYRFLTSFRSWGVKLSSK